MSAGPTPPHAVDHFAVTVPDLEEAARFFHEVFGWTEEFRAEPLGPDAPEDARAGFNVHPRATSRLVMLRTPAGANVELFEYSSPDQHAEPPRNSDVGGHHVALSVDELEPLLARIEEAPGAAVLGKPVSVGPPASDRPARFVYFLTPWGMTMELISFPR